MQDSVYMYIPHTETGPIKTIKLGVAAVAAKTQATLAVGVFSLKYEEHQFRLILLISVPFSHSTCAACLVWTLS